MELISPENPAEGTPAKLKIHPAGDEKLHLVPGGLSTSPITFSERLAVGRGPRVTDNNEDASHRN
jgi:hypothetical protein